MKESRTERLPLRVKPSIKARIEADAEARGQPLTIWFERMVETVIPEKTETGDVQ